MLSGFGFGRPHPRTFSAALRLLCTGASLLALGLGSVASAQNIRQYQFEPAGEGFTLALREVPMPVAGEQQVLVRVHANSLNRRDIMMLQGRYGLSGDVAGQIPLSDGAGEVIAVGPGVTRFEVGDRVAGIFFEAWLDGRRTSAGLASARGGSPGGMLAEVVVSHEDSLVMIPDHLSYAEAATLPCAGVTAWVGLFEQQPLMAQDFVLLEGTGGVSMMGLMLAAAADARPIITSSSDAKLDIARDLGAFATANYRENEDWQDEVLAATGGSGVNYVLEVGGRDTLERAMRALALDGHVALIGGLSGFAPQIGAGSLLASGTRVQGTYVGSRAHFEALNDFMSEHQLRPYIGATFAFEDAAEAFEFMDSGSYVGKIVITH